MFPNSVKKFLIQIKRTRFGDKVVASLGYLSPCFGACDETIAV